MTRIMARTSIKATYALDVQTVRALERMAKRWKVSKSEALRRAIHLAEREPRGSEALHAFEELQRSLGLTSDRTEKWLQAAREEREASSGRRERTGR